MIYFLDTNIVVFCLRGQSAPAMRRLHAVHSSDVRVPLQVHAELLVGAAKSANPQRNQARVLAFIAPFSIVLPDPQIEAHYNAIRTGLEPQAHRSVKRISGLPQRHAPQPARSLLTMFVNSRACQILSWRIGR